MLRSATPNRRMDAEPRHLDHRDAGTTSKKKSLSTLPDVTFRARRALTRMCFSQHEKSDIYQIIRTRKEP